MDSQRSIRYPNLSTADVFKLGGSTLAESPPVSPGTRLPAYGDEGAPPQYQEDGLDAKEKAAKAKAKRRILFVRLLTSIFITVLVSLVVAAVVGRIHDRQAAAKKSHKDAQAKSTMMTATPEEVEARQTTATIPTSTTQHVQFAVTGISPQTTPPTTRGTITFDCPYLHQPATATTTTTTTGDHASPTEITASSQFGALGVSVFTIRNCQVTRASYRAPDDGLTYRSMMSCANEDLAQ